MEFKYKKLSEKFANRLALASLLGFGALVGYDSIAEPEARGFGAYVYERDLEDMEGSEDLEDRVGSEDWEERIFNLDMMLGAVDDLEDYTEKYLLPEEQRNEDNVKIIAEALYAEARGLYQNEDYLKNVGSSVITRAMERNERVSDVLYNGEYSYANSGDPNKKIVGMAEEHASQNYKDEKAYEVCLKVASDLVYNGADKLLTHYFVRKKNSDNFPSWAKGEPDAVIEHGDRVTRFYYLSDNAANEKGQVFSGKV